MLIDYLEGSMKTELTVRLLNGAFVVAKIN